AEVVPEALLWRQLLDILDSEVLGERLLEFLLVGQSSRAREEGVGESAERIDRVVEEFDGAVALFALGVLGVVISLELGAEGGEASAVDGLSDLQQRG